MATIHKVKWAVSMTPIAEDSGEDGGHLPIKTLHEDIRKSFGGKGETTTSGVVTLGGTWDNGNPNAKYTSCTAGNTTIGVTTSSFIIIIHTGFEYDSANSLSSTAAPASIIIKADNEKIAEIPSKGAWFIPVVTSEANGISQYKMIRSTASSVDIAVQILTFGTAP